LIDLILDDDEEFKTVVVKININQADPVWDRLGPAADQLVLDIYRHLKRCPSLSRRSRVFLASAALLGEAVSAEWLADAVEGVQDFKAHNPGAYLHKCLQTGMEAHVPGGNAEYCERLLVRVRSAVSRWVGKRNWRPDVVVARERAAKAKPIDVPPPVAAPLPPGSGREALREGLALAAKASAGT
jgi:hypothetical protein